LNLFVDKIDAKNSLKAHAFDTWAAPFGRCLMPPGDCNKAPVRAHSLQRQGSVRLLNVDGHVVMLCQHIYADAPPRISFERVGIRNATVFTGLCGDHDASLFRPIETNVLDLGNPEHLFLLAYRAVLRETHVCLEAATRLQSVYLKKISLGLGDANNPTRADLFVVHRLIVAYETWLYKTLIDEAFQNRNSAGLQHDIIDLGQTGPCIAVSSLFSLDDVRVKDDVARVSLTIIPTPKRHTVAVISYIRRDARKARVRLRSVLHARGERQRYLLSRLVLERSDNIVFNPAIVEQFSAEQRRIIVRFFEATVLRNDKEYQDDRLNLFNAA
jgi:hypothetical protein